ncbi:MAG: Sigma-54 factor interaction domain-containing protein [Bacteroidetes bacterium]|nr:Sigma-54 factor interaction domain-containing protein [Bacteroidota bacterium]
MQLQTLTMITQSEVMRNIIARVETIAGSESSVLFVGETGVGKELFADYVHRMSNRVEMPLVKVALSAVPPELLESELFGHDRGAYTSASNEKKGLFELANGGSIFLDDIDDFPFALQSKLLRVLESREVKRVGGTASIPLNVRLITASKLDLGELVERGLFRADLFYRINVVPIVIPPLRSRKEDIPLLIEHFLRRFVPNREIQISRDAMRAFVEYGWPGNVRELRNIVQRIALFADGEVQLKDLPPEIKGHNGLNSLLKACSKCFTEEHMTFEQVVACLEANLLRQAMKESGGNQRQAAQFLKMSPSTFRDKIKKYNLIGSES